MHSAHRSGLGALVLLVAACSGNPSVVPSSSEPAPSGNDGVAGPLPPGCESIELRDPDGELIVLDGPWVEAEAPVTGAMTWWMRAMGDCVWAIGVVDDPEVAGAGSRQNLRGTLRPDFTIDAEITPLGPPGAIGHSGFSYADVRLLIEFSEGGGVRLREDRVPGEVGGPRCPEANFCLSPLVLVPEDQAESP